MFSIGFSVVFLVVSRVIPFFNIVLSLHRMFGGKGMSKGTLVKDNMVCMIELFDKMEIIGVKIDRET